MAKTNKVGKGDTALSKNLTKLLENKGKSNLELANFIGISTESIRKYLNENVSPSSNVLKKIAEFFNVSSDYLLGLVEIENKPMEDKEINKITGLSGKSIQTLKCMMADKKKWNYTRCINALLTNEGLLVLDGIVDYLKLNNNEFSAVPDYGDSIYFGIKPQKDKSFLLSSEDVSLFKFIKIQNALKTLKNVIKEDER